MKSYLYAVERLVALERTSGPAAVGEPGDGR